MKIVRRLAGLLLVAAVVWLVWTQGPVHVYDVANLYWSQAMGWVAAHTGL
jgi:thiol:disulfide interchange protein